MPQKQPLIDRPASISHHASDKNVINFRFKKSKNEIKRNRHETQLPYYSFVCRWHIRKQFSYSLVHIARPFNFHMRNCFEMNSEFPRTNTSLTSHTNIHRFHVSHTRTRTKEAILIFFFLFTFSNAFETERHQTQNSSVSSFDECRVIIEVHFLLLSSERENLIQT